ncbi:MAG: carbon monoxide dehydrogenase subunit G [Reyranella sp.]|uniref:CoxG family protein n=1 Tax=Reyranella sp. TaxID=1929291 RepID=UPI00272F04E7|nr:carbon monoxide dehydrogenase subunit G [Reyranella sp.]MDP1960828.1 carbon monoxide dehydrogenase subunit G [Reyranella sp.]MDP2373081.1 carbon monoxide dehydrogenase subunit G [Reyranella sp.]
MEIKGEYKIAASREKVFAALNDVAILQACIPGCESLEKTSDTEMKAKVRMRIGPVSASFTGKVTLSDLDPPNGYKISGEGQGGAAGFAKGGAVVTLREDGADTVLNYNVDAQVGGKIAQVGARLIDGTARKLADEFFNKFAAMVGAPPPGDAAAAVAAPAAAPTPSAAAQRGYKHWIVIGVGAVVLVLVFLASR